MPEPSPDGIKGSILLIEDDPSHAEAIVRGLEAGGVTRPVRWVSSLEEGRRSLLCEVPLLVLADLHLRDGKALDFFADGHRLDCPLLILTSRGDERTAVQAMRLGAMDYVVKSAEAFLELPRTVDRVLRQWRLARDHERAQRALGESEQRFRALFSAAPDAQIIYEPAGTIVDCNRAAEALLARQRSELFSCTIDVLGIVRAEGEASDSVWLAGDRATGSMGPELMRLTRDDGACVDIEVRSVPLSIAGQTVVLATLQDVSARLAAERARHQLEEQLHQASKMEAIGRLAGGIAHDFNNLLTVISGNAELLQRGSTPRSPLALGLHEISQSAARAAALTTQLLAFSRKQIIEPRIVDLDALLDDAARMLQRLIGENVTLTFRPARNLFRVKVDPNQIEQLMVNLAVNARDAMRGTGILDIETCNITLDPAELADQPDVAPGEFVRLCVRDDGAGMSEETLSRMFEPFFTTKERGRGTGLGLSIIYGAVKQNGGFIRVDSELGRGSCFDIYLPRARGELTLPEPKLPSFGIKGSGRVLLVEDEDAVRQIAARFLRNAGYDVTGVGKPTEALQLLVDRASPPIDVLVTDVVLPEMNGQQLFQRLAQLVPGLRVVFMSGYPEEVNAQHGRVDTNLAFVKKPFTQDELAGKVHEALQGKVGAT